MKKSLQKYKDKINDMLLDEAYEFANDILKKFLVFIETREHLTPAQQIAIDHILKSKPNSDTYSTWMK